MREGLQICRTMGCCVELLNCRLAVYFAKHIDHLWVANNVSDKVDIILREKIIHVISYHDLYLAGDTVMVCKPITAARMKVSKEFYLVLLKLHLIPTLWREWNGNISRETAQALLLNNKPKKTLSKESRRWSVMAILNSVKQRKCVIWKAFESYVERHRREREVLATP